MTLFFCSGHMVKVKVKLLVFDEISAQYLLTPLLGTVNTSREQMRLGNLRETIIPIAFQSQGHSRSNYWSSSQHCPLNILVTICFIITKLGTVVATREWIIPCILGMQPFSILHKAAFMFLKHFLFMAARNAIQSSYGSEIFTQSKVSDCRCFRRNPHLLQWR